MKTMLLSILFFSASIVCFGQETGKSQTVGAGSGTCTCQPGQSVCQADALFMTCCTCCQAGSSCGSWTAFGLCGCKCESTGSSKNSEVRFYPTKYDQFMNYLDENGIASGSLRQYRQTASKNLSVQTDSKGTEFLILSGEELQNFTDNYLRDMKALITNSRNSAILDLYLNKK